MPDQEGDRFRWRNGVERLLGLNDEGTDDRISWRQQSDRPQKRSILATSFLIMLYLQGTVQLIYTYLLVLAMDTYFFHSRRAAVLTINRVTCKGGHLHCDGREYFLRPDVYRRGTALMFVIRHERLYLQGQLYIRRTASLFVG